MDFQIIVLGLNHRTANVAIRERFALTSHSTPGEWALPPGDKLRESLILSTCNRVEVMGIGTPGVREQMLQNWASACGDKPAAIEPYIYAHQDVEAARHVFTVASSLDSMVLGEPQILGQLKDAYRKAVTARATGPVLNTLMHKAFSVAKRVRNETAVAASAVSISYAAVELAKRIFGVMAGHRAMLIGAGEMAELAALHLVQAGIDELLVLNRTFERAQELAKKFRGRPLPFEQMLQSLEQVDIVISSTGSRDPILGADDIKKVLRARRNRPVFLIDISVPRDIDTAVNALDNVYLYDIDDLKEVVEENIASRREEAARAALIIDEEVGHFAEWLQGLEIKPAIMDLVEKGEAAASLELARTLKRLGPVNDETRQALEALAHSLVKRLQHDPIMYLKARGMNGRDTLARIDTIRRVFNLNPDMARKA